MLLPFKLICVDLETTGLNSHLSSIIQIGAIILNEDLSVNLSDNFNEYVKPLDSYRDIKSMQVNNISEETLKNAMCLSEVLECFESFCGNNKILASWGSYFDIPFLKKQYQKINRNYPFSHKCIDLKTIAIWENAKKDIIDNKGLKSYVEKLNIEQNNHYHDALYDTINAVKVIKKLSK